MKNVEDVTGEKVENGIQNISPQTEEETVLRFAGYGQRLKQLAREVSKFSKQSRALKSSAAHIGDTEIKTLNETAKISKSLNETAKISKSLNEASKLAKINKFGAISRAGIPKRVVELREMAENVFENNDKGSRKKSQRTSQNTNTGSQYKDHGSRGLKKYIVPVLSYLSWIYMASDVTYQTVQAHRSQKDYKATFLQRTAFHLITTILIPGLAIKQIVRFSSIYAFNQHNFIVFNKLFAASPFSRIMKSPSLSTRQKLFFKYGPFATVALVFPVVPLLVDEPVESILNKI